MKWYRSFPALLIIAVIIPSVAAVVYKWKDDKGIVHYSDKPQKNNKETPNIITFPDASPETINRAQSLNKQLKEKKVKEESEATNERMGQQKQEETQANFRQHIKSCGRARQELNTLHDGRAFRYHENNVRVFLDEKTTNAEINRLNAFIEAECNDNPEDLKLQRLEAERFSTLQIIEDNCVLASDKLMLMNNPEAKSTSSDLKEAKQNVDFWCKNATGDKTIILRRNIINVR
jgi:hypothetical protein